MQEFKLKWVALGLGKPWVTRGQFIIMVESKCCEGGKWAGWAQGLTCGKCSVHASSPLPPFKSILSIWSRCCIWTKIRTLVLVHCHGAEVLQKQEPNQKSPGLSPSSPNLALVAATSGAVTASLRRMSFVWLSLESFPHCPWPFLCSPVSFHFSYPLTHARLSLVNWIC